MRLIWAANKIFHIQWIEPISFQSDRSMNYKDFDLYETNKKHNDCFNKFLKEYIQISPNWYKEMLRTYLCSYWNGLVFFITQIEYRIENHSTVANSEHEIIIERHPLNKACLTHLKVNGIQHIIQSFSYVNHMIFFGQFAYAILLVCFSFFLRFKPKTNLTINTLPSVFMEYEPDELIRSSSLSFWRNEVEADRFNLVYYFDRRDISSLKESKLIRRLKGIYWIDLKNFIYLANKKPLKFVWKKWIEFNKTIKFHKMNWILFYLQVNFILYYWLYASVFSKYNTKILIQHRDTSWKQIVQAKALEDSGGLMIGFHWSNLPLIFPNHWFSQHVLFAWGNIYEKFFKNFSSVRTKILPSGQWIQRNHGYENDNNIFLNGDYTLAVFDSSVSYTIHQTPDHLSFFYRLIIKILRNHKKINAIFKCKSSNLNDLESLPFGKTIIQNLQELIEAKRVFFFPPSISPVNASQFADLSVCFGLNSAGIVAGTYGLRAVHWDLADWYKFPIYEDSEQKILFKDLASFEMAILNAFKGDKLIGDFTKWKYQFSSFEPETAPFRVGKFIQNYMNTVIETGDVNYSLNYAEKLYISENGVDRCFIKKGDSY